MNIYIFKKFRRIPVNKAVPILVIPATTAAPVTPSTSTSTSTTSHTTQNFVTITHNKPRPYQGEKPKDWIKHFDVISLGNGWDNKKKLMNLPPLFMDNKDAKNFYNLRYPTLPPDDYDQFCAELIDTFAPANNDFHKYTQMNERVQSLTEDCVKYYLSKMSLIIDYDPSMVESMRLNLLINGLRDDIKKRVFGKVKTIDEFFQEMKNEDFLKQTDCLTINMIQSNQTRSLNPSAPPPYKPYYNPRSNNNQMYNRGNNQNFRGQYSPGYRNGYPRFYYSQNRTPGYQSSPGNYRGQNRGRGMYYPRPTTLYPRIPEETETQNVRLCHYCHKPNHVIKNCYTRQNDEKYGQKQPQQQQQQQPASKNL